jgi:hypothetical protein
MLHGCDDAEEALRSLLKWQQEYPEQALGKRRCGGLINHPIGGAPGKAYAIWRTKTGWHVAQSEIE